MRGLRVLCLALCGIVAPEAPAQFSIGDHLRTIRNPELNAGDQFGSSFAISGRTMLVSKTQDDTEARESGSAYLLAGKSGAQLAHLANPTPAKFDTFGVSTRSAPDGFYVGTWRDDNHGAVNSGAAYRFAFDGSLQQAFYSPSPDDDDRFGLALAPMEVGVIITAYHDDTLGADAGAAYLFDSQSGELKQTFYDPTPTPGDRFGYSVAAWGGEALIGCYRESLDADNSGAVYQFEAASGSLTRSFFNPAPNGGDLFGKVMTVVGDKLLVAAPKDDTAAVDAGSVYVFDLATGSLLQTLIDPNPQVDGQFGAALSRIGDDFLVGAPTADINGLTDVGVAYLYDGESGSLLATIANPEPSESDFFGGSLQAMVDEIVVGAHLDDWGATDSGSIYIFQGPRDESAVAGDADGDGAATGADFTLWADGFGRFVGEAMASDGDFDHDGFVTQADLDVWAANWGGGATQLTPEPAGCTLAALAIAAASGAARRPMRRRAK